MNESDTSTMRSLPHVNFRSSFGHFYSIQKRMSVALVGFFLFWGFLSSAQEKQAWLVPYAAGKFYGLVDTNGRVVVAPKYESTGFSYFNRVRFKQKGLFGFLDTSGKILIPAKYLSATNFSPYYGKMPAAYVTDAKKKMILIDVNGLPVVDEQDGAKDLVGPPDEVKKEDLHLKKLEEKFKGSFDSIRYAFDLSTVANYNKPNYYLVYRKGKVGLMDDLLQIRFAPGYDELIPYWREFIVARKGKVFSLINEYNTRRYSADLDSVFYKPSFGIVHIKQNGKWGVITNDYFRTLVPPAYDQVYSSLNAGKSLAFFTNPEYGRNGWSNVFVLESNGKKGIYHGTSGYTMEPIYKDILYYIRYHPNHEAKPSKFIDLYYVRFSDGKEGLVDRTGQKRFFK